jgi:predicted nuclease with TOPRIM domain
LYVAQLEAELDTALRARDQTAKALSDAKTDALSADQELREIRGLAAHIEDQFKPRLARLEADRERWEQDRVQLKSLQEEKRAKWESASVAQLSAQVEQLAASLNRPRESFTARSGDLTPDEIATLRRHVSSRQKVGPSEEKVGAMTGAPTDDASSSITSVTLAAASSEVVALRVQLNKTQSELVEAQGLAAKAEQLAIAVESNHHLAASVADAADRVQRSEADLATLTERFHATVEDLKQKWQDAKRENLGVCINLSFLSLIR